MLLRILLVIVLMLQVSWAEADSYDDLITAIILDNIPVAEALIAKGMDVNTTDPDVSIFRVEEMLLPK